MNAPHSELPFEKPKLRGVLHQWAACAALGAGAVLVSLAQSPRVAAAAAVFAGSLVVLFTVSAVYHRVNWSASKRPRMRRMDHASIFILIAGTYTPIAVLALPPVAWQSLLVTVWGAALLGILQSLFWIRAPKAISALLAVAVGWTIIPYLGTVRASLSTAEFALIAAGGIAYTAGAIVYALKRPNPWPGVLGYHEVFHALTIVGAVLHFAAVVHLVRTDWGVHEMTHAHSDGMISARWSSSEPGWVHASEWMKTRSMPTHPSSRGPCGCARLPGSS